MNPLFTLSFLQCRDHPDLIPVKAMKALARADIVTMPGPWYPRQCSAGKGAGPDRFQRRHDPCTNSDTIRTYYQAGKTGGPSLVPAILPVWCHF
ncbi:MAG: hypothetical protein U5K27_02685 [Desulfotignum sp.]|nr:hypothetical protein [Desulfotignum sp.]